MHDTEDIHYWYRHGNEQEAFFAKDIAPLVPLAVSINPAKEKDATAPDLIVDGKVAELKSQQTPFFTAKKKWGIDPRYAVTFNQGDYFTYRDKCPDIEIYFMVDWKQTQYSSYGASISIEPLKALYKVSFSELAAAIEQGSAPLHEYRRRVGDRINETHSFVFDVSKFELLKDFTDQGTLSVPIER